MNAKTEVINGRSDNFVSRLKAGLAPIRHLFGICSHFHFFLVNFERQRISRSQQPAEYCPPNHHDRRHGGRDDVCLVFR